MYKRQGQDFYHNGQEFDADDFERIYFWVNRSAVEETTGSKQDSYKYHCSKSGEWLQPACGKDMDDMVPLGPVVKDTTRICKTCRNNRKEIMYALS